LRPSEWLRHTASIREHWPHSPLPDESITRWGSDLADLPSEQVGAAIEAFVREGREHAPNGGQIRNKVVELALAIPEWPYVLQRLRALLTKSEQLWVNGAPVNERREALAREAPIIREFVRTAGWEQVSRGLDGGNEEARLRDKFAAFCERAKREALYRGLPSAGLRELRRIEAGQPKQIGEVVAEVAGELEAGEEAAA
jgi:hypothetical protein